MSGHYGWKQHTPADDKGNKGDTNFKAAYRGHQSPDQGAPAAKPRVVDITPDPPATTRTPVPKVDTRIGQQRDITDFQRVIPRSIPDAKHTLISSAANVIIVVQDVTGSLGQWPVEIFKRLPLLWDDAVAFFQSTDIEILFIAHGDFRRGDRYPLQVTRFGREQELDSILATIEREGRGGGNGRESSELAAYYLATRVDTSSARNVSCFFITDEKGYDRSCFRSCQPRTKITRKITPSPSKTKTG